jgi:hypothetical protein
MPRTLPGSVVHLERQNRWRMTCDDDLGPGSLVRRKDPDSDLPRVRFWGPRRAGRSHGSSGLHTSFDPVDTTSTLQGSF